ncbi:MAG: hypothetical protein ACLGHT_03140 [Acidimicrobiia bacterium]
MPSSKRRQPRQRRKGPTPKNRAASATTNETTVAGSRHPSQEAGTTAGQASVAPSARYTPKVKTRGPFRPTWHKVVGALMIVLGLAVFVLNDLDGKLPGGHSELYALLAIGIAASSLWWFGAFDRPPELR